MWGAVISNVSEPLKFNGMLGDVSRKLYDTCVSSMNPTYLRGQVADFPPAVSYSTPALYARLPQAGEFTMKAYTSEFKVSIGLGC